MVKKSDVQRFLFLMEGAIEPRIVGGPYRSEADRTAGIIETLKKNLHLLTKDGPDTIHMLDIPRRGHPRMGSFTGGFMTQLRRLAEGQSPVEPNWLIYPGAAVYRSSGTGRPGVMTGGRHACRQVEGCTGTLVSVRWLDGKISWPCTHGMTIRNDGTWRITCRKSPEFW